MNTRSRRAAGFTLIELLSALLVLALLALMSYRGLGVVLQTRDQVRVESSRWLHAEAFLARLERDVRLATPRPVRTANGLAPAWLGQAGSATTPQLEFTRAASIEGVDMPQRVGYGLNDRQEIELWVWPRLDNGPNILPSRYPVLSGVVSLKFEYLDAGLAWKTVWPVGTDRRLLPRALRVRVDLGAGNVVMRLFAVQS
ncbi:MAG TPA: type II secretion system minor pseudopilin GspJ [Rhodanobacter sp.]